KPVGISIQYPLFRRHRRRVATDPEQGQYRLQRRGTLQDRIEFRPLREPVLRNDVAREIPREHKLHLAGHGFGVEGSTFFVALAVRQQKYVLAPVDQDARLRLVTGRDEVDASD